MLDEPLANLDYKLREELRSEIPKIFETSGAIFVYATTDPEEALLLGGNTACVSDGSISQYGNTKTVYHRPNSRKTADIFSSPPMNFVSFVKSGDEVSIGGELSAITGFETLDDGTYSAGFRPNHLSLDNIENSVLFSTYLKSTELTGSETFLHLDHKNDHWVALMHGIKQLNTGQDHNVYVCADHLYIFEQDGRLKRPAHYTLGGS